MLPHRERRGRRGLPAVQGLRRAPAGGAFWGDRHGNVRTTLHDAAERLRTGSLKPGAPSPCDLRHVAERLRTGSLKPGAPSSCDLRDTRWQG